jgi:Ca2+-binding RTX toxin-like protein
LANVILGNEAANTLDGKGGADDMRGGAGDDLYIVDNALDTVTETAAGGIDQVNASVSMVLGANVENLTLTGAAAINGTGNAAANVLNGNAADNRLDGLGGSDAMAGGLGNDVYTIDDLFDLVTEFANEGVDRIESATTGVNLAFVGFANVENAALTGALSNNLTGSASANVLTGNAGNNAIDGKGGADTMRGGLGNDVYTVDDAGDIVAELAGQGVDKVVSSLAYTLGLNVENLDLSGALAIDGTGNTLANVLTGNSAANRLDGGVGADTMAGGGGNDTYVVDNAGDVVTEIAAQGTDRVEARVSYTLTAEVEDLTLTGAAAIAGTGNALANLIVGNAAGNTIDGLLGADTLTGGLGKDIFVFSQVNAVDTLTDFTPIDDTMRLSNAAFGFALTPGVAVTLVANATPVSAAAVPTFLYDTDNGRLSVDLDGTGLGFSPVLFAILTGAPVITAADFQVVA